MSTTLATRMSIPEGLEQAALQLVQEDGDVYHDGSKLKDRAHELCGYGLASIVPSDFCYNLKNRGSRKIEMFLWERGGFYRYVGRHYIYDGPIYSFPRY